MNPIKWISTRLIGIAVSFWCSAISVSAGVPRASLNPPTDNQPLPEGTEYIRRSALAVHQAVFGCVEPSLAWDYYVTNIDKSGPFAYYEGHNFAGQAFSFDTAASLHETTVLGTDGRDVRVTLGVGMLTGPAGEAAWYTMTLEGASAAGLVVLGTTADQTAGREFCQMMWERGGRYYKIGCNAADQLYTVCTNMARADFFACLDKILRWHEHRLIACGVGALSRIGCLFVVPVPIVTPLCVGCVAALACRGVLTAELFASMENAGTESDRVRECCCEAARARQLGVPPVNTVSLCTYKCPLD